MLLITTTGSIATRGHNIAAIVSIEFVEHWLRPDLTSKDPFTEEPN